MTSMSPFWSTSLSNSGFTGFSGLNSLKGLGKFRLAKLEVALNTCLHEARFVVFDEVDLSFAATCVGRMSNRPGSPRVERPINGG